LGDFLFLVNPNIFWFGSNDNAALTGKLARLAARAAEGFMALCVLGDSLVL
jgi:hypothetical protein